jgi:tight adherence protein B
VIMAETVIHPDGVFLYQAAATLFAMLGAFLLTLSLRPAMEGVVRRQEELFHAGLVELFLFDVTPRQLTYVMFGGAVVTGALCALFALSFDASGTGVCIAFFAGLFAGFWVPQVVIVVMQRRRRQRLNEQLIDGLVTLSNGMRAGLNLVQSMRLIEQNGQPPISQEFGLMLREFEHGTSVDEVLHRAAGRIKLHHYKLLFAAMETARVRGGNLPETLDRLGEALREIMRLEEKIRALTAENQTSARYMALMPAVVLVMYYFIDASWVATLFEETLGLFLLLIAVVLNLVGFLWIRKIVTFEV